MLLQVRRQVLELHDAAQMRDVGSLELGDSCLHDTGRLARDQRAVPGVSRSLLDNIGKFGGHFDNIDAVCLEAGAHFVLGPQRDEASYKRRWGAHSII